MSTITDTLEYFESKGLDTTEALILTRLKNGTKEVKDLMKGIKPHVFHRRLRRLKRKHRLIQNIVPDHEEDGRIGRYALSSEGMKIMAELPA